MRHSIDIPTTFRIVALSILSATLLGTGSFPVMSQPAEDPAPASIMNPAPSSTPFAVDAVGTALHSPVATVRATELRTVYLNPPEPSASGLSLAATQARPSRPLPHRRWQALWAEFTSPGFLLGSMGPAIPNHLNDDPASWRDDALGYGFRVGSSASRLLIEGGVAHGLAAATRLDLRFRPRGYGRVASRLRYAALEAVTARTADGTRVPNAPRIVGTYGAVLAQQRWQSGDVRPVDAALSTVLSLGIDVAVNVITEFAGSP